ncbi:MAG: patatin-like phospholipase family protein [Bacteroidales bacterium]|nr:patatin-like phospholipase family protein [Bacteroidales bacterium]
MKKYLFVLFALGFLRIFLRTGLCMAAPGSDSVQQLQFTVWEVDSVRRYDTEKYKYKGLRPRIGVVLSGGGAKGIAHVGVLKVLEELDIPIDYIGGTSMGSIIGGLYAYGYTAHELDSILRAADWSKLLNDSPDWTNVFYLNKDNYVLHLPFGFKENTSLAPIGFLKGQHINNLFYTLTSRAYRFKDFKEFNIPFFCVAANIVNGQAAYMESGNLAKSMRASMAVPGVFSPVQIDTMMLVDGGVLNNFPVDKMREKGMDIIIGVDVGFSYAGVEHVSNMMDVLEEVIFMGSKMQVMTNRANCDIFIKPDMTGFSTTSFAKTDSLLARGERSARDKRIYTQLQQLAEELKEYVPEPAKEKRPYLPPEALLISKIEYNGLKSYNYDYINQFLQIETDKWCKLSDITAGVDRLYGLSVFKSVSYELQTDTARHDEATVLVLNIEESPANAFKVGFRYDNTRMAALLAGVEFQNFGLKNSVLTLDVELSKMPAVSLNYRFMPNWRSSKSGKKKYSMWVPSLNLGLNFFNTRTYLYRNPDDMTVRTSDIRSNRYQAKLSGQSNWKCNILGFGLAYEYADNQVWLESEYYRYDIFDNHYLYPYVYYRHDNYNARFFPTKGFSMVIDVYFPFELGKASTNAGQEGRNTAPYFLGAYWKGDFAIAAGKRVCFYPGFTLGTSISQKGLNIPIQFQFFQGGCTDLNGLYTTMMPGVLLGQSSGFHLANLRLTAQVMIIKNLYLSLRGGVGKAAYDLSDFLTNLDKLIYGGNVGLSYNTPIGPVGLSFQTSNIHKFNLFLHIGYWF